MDVKLILHPTDGSESASKALDFACEFAAERKTQLLVLHVQRRHGNERIPQEMEEYSRVEQVRETEAELLKEAAKRIVADAEDRAQAHGLNAVDTLILEGDPARQIAEAAKKRNVDVIVMGSRGLSDLEGLLLGSVSHKVARSAPCTCVIVR